MHLILWRCRKPSSNGVVAAVLTSGLGSDAPSCSEQSYPRVSQAHGHYYRSYEACGVAAAAVAAAMSKLLGVKKNRHIAGGNFGEVWQGEWDGQPVAIKVAKGASPEALLREVEVAVSIKAHPNLVIVYGICDGVEGELQLVLEYCEDGALLDWLRRLDKVCLRSASVAAARDWAAHADC